MPNATITFNSNLTHNDSLGGTVTSATTSDTITGTAGTVAHTLNSQQVTVAAHTAAQAVTLGSVDVTKEYAVRFRNLGWATTSTSVNSGGSPVVTYAPCVEIVLQVDATTYRPLGRVYATETLGPVRMVPQSGVVGYGAGYPKLMARVTDSASSTTGVSPMNLEVIAGDMGAPAYTA